MKKNDPDLLLLETNRTIMGTAFLLSIAIHALIVLGTSFPLYRDWHTYGLHSPSTIKMLKKEQAEQVRDEARREAAEMQAAQAAAAEAESATRDAQVITAPELEPLPPKSSFSLGEDFEL